MALSHDVTLPREQEATFPDRCVACGTEGPEDLYTVRQRPLSFLPFLSPLFSVFTSKVEASAPACRDCREECVRQVRYRSLLSFVLLAGVATVVIVWHEQLLPTTRGTRKLAFLGYALIGVGPTILLDVFAPRAFDITARKDTVDYEFRSESYAEEFADNNGAAVE